MGRDDVFIVVNHQESVVKSTGSKCDLLRDEVVKTSRRFGSFGKRGEKLYRNFSSVLEKEVGEAKQLIRNQKVSSMTKDSERTLLLTGLSFKRAREGCEQVFVIGFIHPTMIKYYFWKHCGAYFLTQPALKGQQTLIFWCPEDD